MKSEEYRIQIMQPDVLDHTTLNVTLKEVAFVDDFEIAIEINRIISNNRIEKPDMHLRPNDTSTNYYRVDLAPEHIERIIDLLHDLEVENIGVDGETTTMASFYASLTDKWSALG
jgi:hypothetical protein